MIAGRLRISGRLEGGRHIGGFPADWRISGRLKDIRQIGGAFPAAWRIAGRLEDFRQVEDFRQIRGWLAV